MSEPFNRSAFVTPSDPELFRPVCKPVNLPFECSRIDEIEEETIPETQYDLSTYRYVSPYKRDDAIARFDMNGSSFLVKVFRAFPVSKIIQFRFTKDQLDVIIEQSNHFSFSVTMGKDIFDAYEVKSDEVLINISSRQFLHVLKELDKDGNLLRLFYCGEGSDLITDMLGPGEFVTQYTPTISTSEYKTFSTVGRKKEIEIVLNPELFLRVLKSTNKRMNTIVFSFLYDTFEITLRTKDITRGLNICYNDSCYVYKVESTKDAILEYPLNPFLRIQKALKLSNFLNLSIDRNGLICIFINVEDMKGTVANFELYVVPSFNNHHM